MKRMLSSSKIGAEKKRGDWRALVWDDWEAFGDFL